MRGWIMATMALDHASAFIAHRHGSEFWGGEITRYDSVLPFLTRFITHFCAPGFFFLMGTGMALFAASRRRSGWTWARIGRFYVTRGLLLVVVNHLVESPAWILGYAFQIGRLPLPMTPGGGGQVWIGAGVLTALGLTLVVGGLLLALPAIAWLAIGLAGVGVTNAFTPPPTAAATLFPLWQRLLLIPGQTGFAFVLYPLIPWFAIAAFGVVFGRWLLRDERAALRAAPWIGIASIGVAIALRALGGFGNLRPPRDSSWIEFLNFVKYPPALVFSAFTVGGDLVLLGIFARARGWLARAAGALEVFGRAPLFFYIAHLYLYGLLGALFFRRAVSLPTMYLVWLAGLVPLWFSCGRYRRFKETKPAESLWRFF